MSLGCVAHLVVTYLSARDECLALGCDENEDGIKGESI